jgi:acetolactate synthase I/II/III large subunit
MIDGGKLFLDAVTDLGIDYVFYNPGSDYYPILEHLAAWQEEGKKKPGQIMCLTEQLALCMAHGYSMATQKAQIALVHAAIGTLQFGGSLHNVHRGRAPVLLVSGRAPYTFENELPGGKDSPHHWDQELFDQAGPLREFTKWQYELRTNANLRHVLSRALQVANSEPQGPVYLILPRELLAEKFETPVTKSQLRYQVPSPPEPDSESLGKIADLLLAAEKPIIITEYLGRNKDSMLNLVHLSETISIGVMELSRRRTNFPTTHPNYLPTYPKTDLESADLIFLIDVDVPWIPSSTKLKSDAKVIQIDIDPAKSRYPMWGFPIDISVSGSSLTALPRLLQIIEKKLNANDPKKKIAERATKLKSRHDSLKSKLRESVEKASATVTVETTFALLNKMKKMDCIIMNEGVSYTRAVEDYLDSAWPGTFFGLGGSSLGDGIGNALGLKLANPGQDVVCIIGDGGFIYSNPLSTFWAASKYQLPILTIMINNGGYLAMKRSVDKFYPEGVSRRTGHYAGVGIEPEPDYVGVARACGTAGWRVEKSSEIEIALTNGLREIANGKSALIELVVSR